MRPRLSHRLRITGRLVVIGIVVSVMASSSWAGGKKNTTKIDTSKLVWPSPPDQPRILFLGQYNGELDVLGKKAAKAGMLSRLAGVSVAPEERPRLQKPYGVAVDSKGRIFVADTPQHVVFVFDLEHKTVEFRGDNAPANIVYPIGVAVDEQDRLFVSDSKLHQITCFAPDGSVVGVFGEKDLDRPAGMAVDNPLHRLYVADAGARRIAVFDLKTLKLITFFAEYKDKNEDRSGALTNPNSIAVDPDGLIYVTDAFVPRVFVYDTDGNFVRVWGKRGDGPGMFARPKGIAIDSDGHVYVADAQLNRLQIFSSEGTPLLELGGYGVGPGQFMLMAGLASDPQANRIIAVDQFPPRIEVFRYISDAEAEAAKKGQKIPAEEPAAQPAVNKAQTQAPPAPAAQPAGPTIEELQKELAELKAKLAAQEQQKKDAASADSTKQPSPEGPKTEKEAPKSPQQ
jgi:DNA-binding beta-propeller fold protein YncE